MYKVYFCLIIAVVLLVVCAFGLWQTHRETSAHVAFEKAQAEFYLALIKKLEDAPPKAE